MNLLAESVVRAMRGDSKSYLLGTNDGNFFVTKFSGLIGARRRLINEWIGSKLLSRVGVATPAARIIETTEGFIDTHRETFSAAGLQPSSLLGSHFGSKFPGHPSTTVVYDYLPDHVLAKVENLGDFVGTLLVDLLCCKTSRRQAIFVRSTQQTGSFQALMIDNDEMLAGEKWRLEQSTAPGLYPSLAPYATLTGVVDIDPWLKKIESIPESFFLSLASGVPTDWKQRDSMALTALLQQLSQRRRSLRSLALTCLGSNRKSFPQWVHQQSAQFGFATSVSAGAISDWLWPRTGNVSSELPVESGFSVLADMADGRLDSSDKASSVTRLIKTTAPTVTAPNGMVNKAKRILTQKGREAKSSGRIAFRRIKTILEYDSMFDLQPAGIRSLSSLSGDRSLLYRAGEYSLDLRVEPTPEALNWTLVGQLSNDDSPEDEMINLPVRITAGRRLIGETLTNEFGEFIVPDLPRRRLHLYVGLAAEGKQLDLTLNQFAETQDPERN